jgi:hypothetical protein
MLIMVNEAEARCFVMFVVLRFRVRWKAFGVLCVGGFLFRLFC